MAGTTGLTTRLCDWVCSTGYSDIPAEVRKEAVTIIYDTIGGMIASSTLSSCQPVVEIVKAMGGNKDCSVVGHPVKTTVTYAALANGTIGHGDEVDSTGQHRTGHFAAVTVPAAITMGQYVKASGKELIRALALGSEVAARIRSVQSEFASDARARQFSGNSANTLGAAVVAGILLGLDATRMEHAVGLAAHQASGLGAQFHDPTHESKSLGFGITTQAGVLAALLAQRGFHGTPEILTVENGFFDAFTGYADYASLGNRVLDDLGNTYLIRQIAYKRFPVGRPDQAPLYAFLQLLKSHKLTADDIEQVEVNMSRHDFWVADTLKHPSVHLPTILSLAAVFGDVCFQHIHQAQYYQDPRVETFKDRIKLLPDRDTDIQRKRFEAEIRVYTRNGEVLNQQLCAPLMNEEEIQHKFRSLVGLRVNQEKMLDLESKLKGVEAVDNVASLISELELSP
ncbi:MAG: MmgE/PrpD family protein [Deltaproteobacteria bacterium]|nr:MmgE/PrpD family protein [Deltaproteobacteria bacterium]